MTLSTSSTTSDSEQDRFQLGQLSTNVGDSKCQDPSFVDLLSESGTPSSEISEELPEADWSGCTIGLGGRYRIAQCIGQGGMAKVYLATDAHLHGAAVAIKAPLSKLVCRRGVRERLEREFRALIELEHPHICRVIDTGRHDNIPFLVMPYLSGKNLAERYLRGRVNAAPRTIEEMFDWLRPIGTAIDFMHRRHYVHRDLKPQNILFDEEGNPYVADLGIVRAIGEGSDSPSDPGLTTLNGWLGTPGFTAPEVGARREVDGRVDLYSLAAVVYVFLTDTAPFPGQTPLEIRIAQLQSTLTPAHQLNALVPATASDVLAKALAVDPAERHASCLEFIDALEAACGKAVVQLPLQQQRPTHRRRILLSTAALLAAVGIGFFGLSGLAPVLPMPFTEREDVSVHVANAKQYLANGEPEAAIEILTAAIKRRPDDASLYAARGNALRLANRPEQALAEYTAALKLDRQAEYFLQRGQIALTQPDGATQAQADFTAALELQPRADIYGYRGLANLLLGQFDAGIKDYDVAIEAGPTAQATSEEMAAWHNGRGLCHLRNGEAQLARTDFESALRLQPSQATYRENVRVAQQQLARSR